MRKKILITLILILIFITITILLAFSQKPKYPHLEVNVDASGDHKELWKKFGGDYSHPGVVLLPRPRRRTVSHPSAGLQSRALRG
jgi:hypothetical protein